jgi:uncharacterized protein (DUF2342 family)
MIDMAAKMALREVMRILDEQADDISNMIVEGMFDPQSTMTNEIAADYLADVLTELSLQIGQVAATLKEVVPSNKNPQPVV